MCTLHRKGTFNPTPLETRADEHQEVGEFELYQTFVSRLDMTTYSGMKEQ